MVVPTVAVTRWSDPAADRPLLVLGHSIGTSAEALWSRCARLLTERFEVLALDLPGHGRAPLADGPFDAAELAAGAVAAIDAVTGEPERAFTYAGDSVGGELGLQLLLDHPRRVAAAVLLCTGARIEAPDGWAARAARVRAEGTAALVDTARRSWFAAGFAHREPEAAETLLDTLAGTPDEAYAALCGVLAEFDVRERLWSITAPVLAVAGAEDRAAPAALLREIADEVADGRFAQLAGVGHQAPAEDPQAVAALIAAHAARTASTDQTRAAGMRVRRAVLGDAHVDRAGTSGGQLARDFQDFITTYAWGSVWTRPGLDRRSRSMITLTALVAGGHHEELELHLRGARRNGLSDAEIAEVLLQSAIYCGVPAANSAFRIAQRVLAEPADAPPEV